jgi:hypothetical protein
VNMHDGAYVTRLESFVRDVCCQDNAIVLFNRSFASKGYALIKRDSTNCTAAFNLRLVCLAAVICRPASQRVSIVRTDLPCGIAGEAGRRACARDLGTGFRSGKSSSRSSPGCGSRNLFLTPGPGDAGP